MAAVLVNHTVNDYNSWLKAFEAHEPARREAGVKAAAVWQAADGTWQMWSCFRKTTAGGEKGLTRFFYRWEGRHPTDRSWKPMGIVTPASAASSLTTSGNSLPCSFCRNLKTSPYSPQP